MRKLRRLFAIAALVACPALPQPFSKKIDALLRSSRASSRSAWGIRVVQLSSGKTLYDHNGDHWFVPASNTKLFSTSLALSRLGPDFRFETTIRATQPLDSAGRISGDLVLVGSGDPTLSSRSVPYRKDDPQRWGGNPLA